MAIITGVVIKGQHIVIPEAITTTGVKAAKHQSHGHRKNQTINTQIFLLDRYVCGHKNHIKSCSTCLHFQQTQPREKIIHHNIPGKPWEVIRADMFTLNNKNFFCIVEYHSTFPIL